MGVFDKIKNALFEEEYVEVDEKPKKVIRSQNHLSVCLKPYPSKEIIFT